MNTLRITADPALPSPLRNRGIRLFVAALLVALAGGIHLCAAGNDSTPSGARRDAERTVNIVALQAGTRYAFRDNPGLDANFALFARLSREAAGASPRPDLICWPEYAISGWPYPKEEVMNGLAESIPGEGPWYRRYRDLARELGVPIVGWLVESAGGKLYSTAFLLDGKGDFKGKYRKVQANLGEQTWWGWSQGERFELIELDGVRYGISICADMWFPETVRCEELLGADVVLHLSIADDMGHLIPARAFDSRPKSPVGRPSRFAPFANTSTTNTAGSGMSKRDNKTCVMWARTRF